ncbi:5', 3'-nucleotidase, cytosolic [Perkinsus chesapeaki]|uniref:5', 3'-nucleotidase, cytosolic n=1 Tax=Perkinsus chesapeaki TaxID=330153 RepID=A0A7J6LQK8_PERCH|nr:5', 3'-nucleotidase, cytosolic [Perkinsus chesapeaki]
MGIVCPRKNQVTVVERFKKFAGDRQDVRLMIVGVRRIRDYEIEYVEEVEKAVGDDCRISLHEVTNDPDSYYRAADALVFASVNEVTPLVLPEAMLRRLPVITTGIAGIPEMLTNGEHGFIIDPEDESGFIEAMGQLADNPELRAEMGHKAQQHAKDNSTLDCMNDRYASIARTLSPICILLDMDGCVVDWDSGFRSAWGHRSDIDRSKSYAMEQCVPERFKKQATELFCSKGFFASLPAMPGSLDAIREMGALPGVSLLLCTSPILASSFCHQEKAQWVKERLGSEWLKRLIITSDKTRIRGDVLIDDKPYITGSENPTWEHVLFTAPYNSDIPPDGRYRLDNWEDWRRVLSRALERVGYRKVAEDVAAKLPIGMSRSRAGLSSLLSGEWSSASLVSMATTPSERPPPTKEDVANLPDFSHELKALGMYRDDYMNWRKGGHKGAKGEIQDSKVLANVSRMLLERAVMDQADDPTEIHVTRLNYRTGYHNWRRGKHQGAKHRDAPTVAAS